MIRYNRNYVEAQKRSQGVIQGRRLTILERSYTLIQIILMLLIAPIFIIIAKIIDYIRNKGGKP